jgi:hypothetical protein
MTALIPQFKNAALSCLAMVLWVGLTLGNGETVKSSLAFNLMGWSLGKSGPAGNIPEQTFYPEPTFLTMSEVGDLGFGVLEVDMLMRYLTHWTYGAGADSTDGFGLDHSYLTINKGFFLLNEGRGGRFDWGLGIELDWRKADLLPNEGYPRTRAFSILGGGIVSRLKMDASDHLLISPAIAYDSYALPHHAGRWITGHGVRADCDIWFSAWPGAYKMTLQPFWHWHLWNGSHSGSEFKNVTTRTFGIKFGFGYRPKPFVPSY